MEFDYCVSCGAVVGSIHDLMCDDCRIEQEYRTEKMYRASEPKAPELIPADVLDILDEIAGPEPDVETKQDEDRAKDFIDAIRRSFLHQSQSWTQVWPPQEDSKHG